MAELKNYDAVVNGRETTLRLTEADAKKRGLTASEPRSAPAKKTAAKKRATPANKASAPAADKKA